MSIKKGFCPYYAIMKKKGGILYDSPGLLPGLQLQYRRGS